MKNNRISDVCGKTPKVLTVLVLAFAAGCGRGPAPGADVAAPTDSPDATARAPKDDSQAIRVVDGLGQPIPGARVLIGAREGTPFAGNWLVADSSGQVATPSDWTSPQPVTAEARGFVRATYFGRSPGAMTLTLRPVSAPQRIVARGNTSGYGSLVDDGWVHVGLTFPALSRSEFASFQLAALVSPEVDVISVAGRSADVPSNVSFPRQTLRYLFFDVTFDKPGYRAFFERPGTYRLVTAHARFRLSDGADSVGDGKPFTELVDLLDFIEAGARDVSVGAGGAQADLTANGTPFSARIVAQAPPYDSRWQALAVALGETRGLLYPTDVKRVASGERKTLAATVSSAKALVALLPKDGGSTGAASDQLSLVIVPAAQTGSQRFVAVPAAPSIRQGASPAIVLRPPSAPAGLRPLLTYASLSTVVPVEGKKRSERKIGRWDLYAEGWATALELPTPPQSAPFPGPLRWEAGFAAGPASASRPGAGDLGPQSFERASHVAKSAVDL